MAGDSLKITVDAQGNAIDELKKVRKGLEANQKSLIKLTSAGEASEAQTKENVRAQREMKDSLNGAMVAAKAAAIAYAGIAAVKAFGSFVKDGEMAANTARRFADALPNAEIALQSFKVATAGLVEETELQEIANRFVRIGVSVDQTRKLLELATKAAMDQNKEVSDVFRILETAVRGETTALMELGVNLDETGRLVAAYAEETGRTTAEISKMEARLKVALPAALEALGEQFDDVNLQDFTTEVQAAEVAIADMESNLSSFVAEGWTEVWDALFGSTRAEQLADISEQMEKLSKRLQAVSQTPLGATAKSMEMLTDTQKALQFQAAQYATVLSKLPTKVKEAEIAKLNATLGQQSPHIIRLIRQYAGLGQTLDTSTDSAKALNDELKNTGDSGAAWSKWLKEVDKITADQAEKEKSRRKSAAASAARTRRAANAAAGEKLQSMQLENDHQARLMVSASELARIDEISRRAKEKHQIELEKLKSKKVKADTLEKMQAEFQLKHSRDMNALIDAAIQKQDEKNKAASKATAEQATALRLARIDARIKAATEPVERARLQLLLARTNAAEALASTEANAAVERLKAQTDLNEAMRAYNEELEKAASAEWTQGLARVSDVLGGMSATASDLGEVGATLATVTNALSFSSGAWSQYSDGQVEVGEAVQGTIGVLGDAAGSFIEDEQAKAAVASAFQVASSIASFATGDIAGGIAHAAAATAFAAVAAGAGGGGAAATAGGSGGASAGASGDRDQQGGFGDSGGRQVIIQFGSGVILGSAAAVGSAIKQAEYANRGTGQAAGY
jgi:hypothetical protein